MINLNRASLSLEPINGAINDAIERAAATAAELPRPYLGASIVGHDCLRRIQFDWWCKPALAARTRDIFDRGHYFEERARQRLIAAGFKFAPPEALAFTAADGALRGHADGIIIHGPDLPGAYLIYPLVWECKALNAKNWRAIERDGLEKTFPHYAAQVAVYQAYLNITNPALFTACNADTCEFLHFLVPFNAERAQLVSDRAANIIEATRAGELLPRGYDDPEDWRCRVCSHRERCWRWAMALPSELTARRGDRHGSRLGDVIRRLISNSEGEAFAALCAIARLLETHGCSFHDLADHLENGGSLSEADKQKIKSEIANARAIGYAEGVKAAEARQHGTGAFRNTDGALEWAEVALYVQREKHRLPDKHHEFIDDMASRTVYGREPSPKPPVPAQFVFQARREGHMKIVKGYGGENEPHEWRLWVVIESEVAGDETMFGFIAKSEAEAFYNALRSHSLADAERLRRVALVRLEHGKYTTPAVLSEP